MNFKDNISDHKIVDIKLPKALSLLQSNDIQNGEGSTSSDKNPDGINKFSFTELTDEIFQRDGTSNNQ